MGKAPPLDVGRDCLFLTRQDLDAGRVGVNKNGNHLGHRRVIDVRILAIDIADPL